MINVVISDDGSVMVNNVSVVVTDIVTSNGVIHVIDGVLLPPEDDGSAPAESPTQNIVEVASGNTNAPLFVQAIYAASLTGAHLGEEPFTVVAPDYAAVNALGTRMLTPLPAAPTSSCSILGPARPDSIFVGNRARPDSIFMGN